MKKTVFILLIFLTSCSTKPVNQVDKKENKTNNTQTKDSWIYQTPWGKSALR